MSLHEDIRRHHEVEGASDRGFGLTVGGILAAIGLVRAALHWGEGLGWATPTLLVVGAALVATALAAPQRLAPLNRGWTRLGLILFTIVNPVVLGLMFFVIITPTGLLLRALGKVSLRLKFEPEAPTYWIARTPPGPDPRTMNNQF